MSRNHTKLESSCYSLGRMRVALQMDIVLIIMNLMIIYFIGINVVTTLTSILFSIKAISNWLDIKKLTRKFDLDEDNLKLEVG